VFTPRCRRLQRDLLTDADGKETIAQRLIEVFFWGAIVCGVALAALGAAFLLGIDIERGRIEAEASKFPDVFQV